MDFYKIKQKKTEKDKEAFIEVYPDFTVVRSKDLMIRGKDFYAVWDAEKNLWSTDEYDIQRLIDKELWEHRNELAATTPHSVRPKLMGEFSSGAWRQYRNYVGLLKDTYTQLDENLTFSNTDVKKEDFVSHKLSYPLQAGNYDAWEEIISVLYDPEERAKIEWAMGAIISGDSKSIQKFLVLYGPPGSGKGTIINIMLKLFKGYYTTFEAKALGQANNSFSTEAFRSNPLVAIQHDGDLSRIEDNTLLNSIISHEEIRFNEKFKPSYDAIVNAFLILGTNKPVKITDAKSGILRRLIDAQPSGRKLAPRRYQALMSQIDFQLGAIAQHCLETYRSMGRDYYEDYRPIEMMLQTDVFYNYIQEYYDLFREQDGTTLKQAWELYKEYKKEAELDWGIPKHKLGTELKNYFQHFDERAIIDDVRVRSWYSGFKHDKFKVQAAPEHQLPLVLNETESLFDREFPDAPAQYSKEDGTPQLYWTDDERLIFGELKKPKPDQVVSTTLKEIDTAREHYVKVPENHIVIDFDLKDETGAKSAELNLEAASQWPATYTEFSKGGGGLHLHYYYDGDVHELSRVFGDGIEIKVFTGNSSLRRRLSKCNNVPIATISSGLPLKEKKMLNADTVKSEQSLRNLIARNLRKEIHPGTKPSMDFIHKILEDAHRSGLVYDVTDMRHDLMQFANNSSNQAMYCLKLLTQMKLKSEEPSVNAEPAPDITSFEQKNSKDDRVVIYDVEVFKNLFIICWKFQGDANTVTMINPSAAEVENLIKLKLVGHFVRDYDNHILYGRLMGLNNYELYQLSKRLVTNVPGSKFGESYNLSHADTYDFAAAHNKKSLKKWQIELGLHHQELGMDWDAEVPDDMVEIVAGYCRNDVESNEAVFVHLEPDYVARQILASISGLSTNDKTNSHTRKIIFGNERKPQSEFVYTDLGKELFPGYEFITPDVLNKKTPEEQAALQEITGGKSPLGSSIYKGEVIGEGGRVKSKPGIYHEVALLDVESMHPASIRELNMFGTRYTKKFVELMNARTAIKNGDLDSARKMLEGKLAPFLVNENANLKGLSDALKTAINSVYGVTFTKYDNPFMDPRNKDNIAAKRGALFMKDLEEAVDNFTGRMGEKWTVVHTKTDSVKIPNATAEIIEFVMEFGEQYGYKFVHEATYEKMALVNDSTYIAKTKPGRKPSYWTATAAQFQHPYVFKTLFSKEPITHRDMSEAKYVTSALYLDFTKDGEEGAEKTLNHDNLRHVGKAGLFSPIKPDHGGALLLREKDGKFYAATGSKGYRWLETEMVDELDKWGDVDRSYFDNLVDKAVAQIAKYGDVEEFLEGGPAEQPVQKPEGAFEEVPF